MEFIYSTEISIPLAQIIAFLLISTFALLFGKTKLALLSNYLFGLYWAYTFNRDYLRGLGLEKFDLYSGLYFGFGLVVVIIALTRFLVRSD